MSEGASLVVAFLDRVSTQQLWSRDKLVGSGYSGFGQINEYFLFAKVKSTNTAAKIANYNKEKTSSLLS